MRRQSVIALGIAVILALFAVYVANAFLTSTQSRADAADAGSARVAVAAVPVDYGVELTPEKVRFVNLPVNSIPPGSFSNINQLMPEGKARVALLPMQINEPILASKVTGDGQNASISALLPDGKRAAAVRINDVSGVAGFIQPNDTVDVLITRQAGTDRGQQVTDVLLQNIRVIAMDQDAKGADGKPSLAKTATLELDPIEAQKLALGQQVGSISLVLRKPGEEQNTATQTVSMTDLRYQLYGGAPRLQASNQPARVARALAPRRTVRRSAPAARTAAPPQPTTSSVEVVRGTQGNSYEVGEYGS
jgi:pilus assembly protein CpaB